MQTQVQRKGVFTAAKDSVVGVFSLVDNTINLGNRVVDQGHKVLDVSEANLDAWKNQALADAQRELQELEKVSGKLLPN
jgi:hypothetical protein